MKTLTPLILAAYIGQTVVYSDPEAPLPYFSKLVTVVSAEDPYPCVCLRDYGGLREIKDFTLIQLVLRPVWEMTKEETLTWCEMVGLKLTHERFDELYAATTQKLRTQGFDALEFHSGKFSESVLFINYARSIGIDCDGLLENGLAVYKYS